MKTNCNKLLLTLAGFLLALWNLNAHAQQAISLEGAWDFTMDRSEPSAHSLPPTSYDDYVMLPGSMLTNGKGDVVSVKTQWTGSLYDSSYYFNPYMARYRQEGEQLKVPFFLTPERHYVGMAWYRKQVYVPAEWKDQHVTLFLERPHIETTVFVNGKEIGHQMSLSVPHRYDVTDAIKVGKKNEIVIGVYNGIENVCVGQDSHSVTDQTQGNWNGIAGRIELQSQWKKLYVKHVAVRLDSVYTGEVKGRGRHKVKLRAPAAVVTVTLADRTSRILWDYLVTVKLFSMADGSAVKPLREEMKMSKDAKDDKDDKDAKDGDEEAEEEEAVLVVEGDENAEDTALSIKHIGTYYVRIDSETHETYYVRKYVAFRISCVYTPAEKVEITNNVEAAGGAK